MFSWAVRFLFRDMHMKPRYGWICVSFATHMHNQHGCSGIRPNAALTYRNPLRKYPG